MAKNQYTYAVARIRSMEVSLFSQADIEQLLACRDEKQCLQLLQEKGWGNADTPSDAGLPEKRMRHFCIRRMDSFVTS